MAAAPLAAEEGSEREREWLDEGNTSVRDPDEYFIRVVPGAQWIQRVPVCTSRTRRKAADTEEDGGEGERARERIGGRGGAGAVILSGCFRAFPLVVIPAGVTRKTCVRERRAAETWDAEGVWRIQLA